MDQPEAVQPEAVQPEGVQSEAARPGATAWAPQRPPTGSPSWAASASAPTSRARPAIGSSVPSAVPSAPDAHGSYGVRRQARPPRRPGRIAALWVGAPLARRILVAYVALGAAIALVVGVGVTVQPQYGSLSPWKGIRVDDLRSQPHADGWAADLAATLAPGAPPECIRFTTIDVGQDLVAVRADTALTYGFSDSSLCSIVPAGFRSRLGLLDTGNGDLRWVHDVASDMIEPDGSPPAGGVVISSMSTVDHASRILVRAGTGATTVIESLSLGTGQVLESTGLQSSTQGDRFAAEGRVVVTGGTSPDGLSYRYELRDADDLSTVVWTGPGNANATMIALDDRLLLGSNDTLQIPLATGIAERWSGPVDTSLGYAVHDGTVFAAKTKGSGVTTSASPSGGFSAYDKTGRRLWSSPLDLRGSLSVTRECLAVTDRAGERLSCLDYRTGATLWSNDLGAFTYAASAIGQRSNDIFAIVGSRNATVVAIDGATGRHAFQTDIPSGALVVGAGSTVAYALAYGISGSRSSVIALDLSSGKRLWAHSAQLQVAVWGGHLVEVGLDGLARRLV